MTAKNEPPKQKITIDWSALEAAYESSGNSSFSDDGGSPYLDTRTGKIVYASDGEDADENDEAIDWDYLVSTPERDSHDESDWIRDFSASLRDREVIHALDRVGSGRGFFRRFKDALAQHGALDQWYAYRDARIKRLLVEWLRDEGIAFDPPPGFEDAADAANDDGDVDGDAEVPLRATIQQVLGGQGVIRLGDVVGEIEKSAPDAYFEYDITIRVRSEKPLVAKERKAFEKRAGDAMFARPKFVDDKGEG